MISLKRLLEKKRREQQIVKERDAILKELREKRAEAKRIRGLPRDEVDALIAEAVGNSNRM